MGRLEVVMASIVGGGGGVCKIWGLQAPYYLHKLHPSHVFAYHKHVHVCIRNQLSLLCENVGRHQIYQYTDQKAWSLDAAAIPL